MSAQLGNPRVQNVTGEKKCQRRYRRVCSALQNCWSSARGSHNVLNVKNQRPNRLLHFTCQTPWVTGPSLTPPRARWIWLFKEGRVHHCPHIHNVWEEHLNESEKHNQNWTRMNCITKPCGTENAFAPTAEKDWQRLFEMLCIRSFSVILEERTVRDVGLRRKRFMLCWGEEAFSSNPKPKESNRPGPTSEDRVFLERVDWDFDMGLNNKSCDSFRTNTNSAR
jgi:hypothetical protein